MKLWFRKFFAVDNEINENTVMGLVSFLIAVGLAVVSIWVDAVHDNIIYFFLGYSAAAFGIGAFKK